jgi:hypothetical protein
MRLFEAMPNMLVFDRTLFVHAGIPREDTILEKVHGPADAQRSGRALPDALERSERLRLRASRAAEGQRPLPLRAKAVQVVHEPPRPRTTMIRGHERVRGLQEDLRRPRGHAALALLRGRQDNADLPENSNYRDVRPMALTIRHAQGVTTLSPFEIEFARFNDPQYNAFFRDQLGAGR